jgi:predicted small lipoprotein YifL
MKKQILALLLTVIFTISLTACGRTGDTADTADTTETVDTAETETVPESTVTDEGEDNSTVSYESPLGYSVEYNTDMFSLTSESANDRFDCIGVENMEAPIYVVVTSYPDMDAETVANGIVLQIGRDDVTAENGTFGQGTEAWIVNYNEEINGVYNYYSYFAVPKGDGTLLLEVGEYVGYEGQEKVDGNIELIIDSFMPDTEDV